MGIRHINERDAWITNSDGDIIGIQLHGRSEMVDLRNPVNADVDQLTGMVSIPLINGRNLLADQTINGNITFIGDSRAFFGRQDWWKNASYSSGQVLPIAPMGITGQGITADQIGTLYFRASDKSLSWQSNGDTQGPYVPMFAGIMSLESGTADRTLMLGVNTLSGLPTSDTTTAIQISGNINYGKNQYGVSTHILSILRNAFSSVTHLAIGGNTTANVIEQLPWINSKSTGPGIDLIVLGANDVSAGVSVATSKANIQTIIDARIALGRKVVLIGETARYATGTTPLTAGQLAATIEYNRANAAYAASRPKLVRFIETWGMTADPAYTDGRPAAGALTDHVHHSARTAQKIALSAINNYLLGEVGYGARRMQGDALNVLPAALAYFTGTGGVANTGASGVVPASWILERGLGADATAVGSIVAKSDGGNWWNIAVAATASGQIIDAVSHAQSMTLTPGTYCNFDIEIDVENQVNINSVYAFIKFTGQSGDFRGQCMVPAGDARDGQENGVTLQSTGPVKIPTGCTGYYIYIYITMGANASGNVRLANASLRAA